MTIINLPSTGTGSTGRGVSADEHTLMAYTTNPAGTPVPGNRVTIVVNDGEFRDITAQAVRALVVGNRPSPTVFTFGSSLARLRQVEGRTFIEPLNLDRLTA